MSVVLLLRHGQSTWNRERRWQGSLDSPLTDDGRDQAEAVVARLRAVAPFGSVASSDLGRAVETARIVTSGLGLRDAAADARWREAHAGEWQGLLVADIERRWPGWLAAERRPADFEPYDRVLARAADALADLGAGRHLVVTHSGLIRTVVRARTGVDRRIPNVGGVWVRVERGGIVVGPTFAGVATARRVGATLEER